LLKLSGEALGGPRGSGLDASVLERVSGEIGELAEASVQVAVVVGGGNLFRGAEVAQAGMRRVTGDHMGMLATVMNALALCDAIRARGAPSEVLAAFEIPGIAEGFGVDKADRLLRAGNVVVLAGGTGNPLFTTDTAACLRGIEIGADIVLKATKVDGVYSADPIANPEAERFDQLTYTEVLDRALAIMDTTAIHLCRDHDMPLIVFDMNEPGALTKIVGGAKVGTRIIAG
jgi:uridylate kinase